MIGFDATRREFLSTSALSAGAAITLPNQRMDPRKTQRSVIQILLTGGPSQLDTWDPKPQAPAGIRSPLGSIATAIPGVRVTEIFPRIARLANKLAFLRTLHHEEAPIHETGQQLIQTGTVRSEEQSFPHFGALASAAQSTRSWLAPAWVGLPGPLGNTGVPISHGQDAGELGDIHGPVWRSPAAILQGQRTNPALYGSSDFGLACQAAIRSIEQGTRVVTINMFDTVFNKPTWDMHAYGGSLPTTLEDYRRHIGPLFDQVFSGLVTDLAGRGMLDEVLVVASGEFGRTPKINARGGRDHWTGCWTALVAGGGIRGGQVLGESDAEGAFPKERPIAPAELVATIYQSLGISFSQVETADQRIWLPEALTELLT